MMCFDCGQPLINKRGSPCFKTYIDPIGNEHKLHKDCFDDGGYASKAPTVNFEGESLAKAQINEVMFREYKDTK